MNERETPQNKKNASSKKFRKLRIIRHFTRNKFKEVKKKKEDEWKTRQYLTINLCFTTFYQFIPFYQLIHSTNLRK